MVNIVNAQKGECMEWVMKNMQDVKYKDEFKYREKVHRIIFYIVIFVNSVFWAMYGVLSKTKNQFATYTSLLFYNFIQAVLLTISFYRIRNFLFRYFKDQYHLQKRGLLAYYSFDVVFYFIFVSFDFFFNIQALDPEIVS